MKTKGRAVAQTRCSVVRECCNNKCIFRMYLNGYKDVPRTAQEKENNRNIERIDGKGFYPQFESIGHGEFVDLICTDYKEKK